MINNRLFMLTCILSINGILLSAANDRLPLQGACSSSSSYFIPLSDPLCMSSLDSHSLGARPSEVSVAVPSNLHCSTCNQTFKNPKVFENHMSTKAHEVVLNRTKREAERQRIAPFLDRVQSDAKRQRIATPTLSALPSSIVHVPQLDSICNVDAWNESHKRISDKLDALIDRLQAAVEVPKFENDEEIMDAWNNKLTYMVPCGKFENVKLAMDLFFKKLPEGQDCVLVQRARIAWARRNLKEFVQAKSDSKYGIDLTYTESTDRLLWNAFTYFKKINTGRLKRELIAGQVVCGTVKKSYRMLEEELNQFVDQLAWLRIRFGS